MTAIAYIHRLPTSYSERNVRCPECGRINSVPTNRIGTGWTKRCWGCGTPFRVEYKEDDQ
ncbi:hypothetical protein [Bifidobacterium stellenboschense]|uniref:Uncharacterized protein n=1 Tax=Bifidobacterium stellenboschense TaxID=762211 RepID=A0A087DQN2_9BIFI|nr:hypothetical protein [Bifidobacterium stellenboschense]KFI97832.1 hypothetical protein BSTEL_0643 [Bifidobacterium stellenboschense]